MPYKWTLTSGKLPPGLELVLPAGQSGRVGFLVGQATTAGSYSWRFTVSDDSKPTPQTAYNDYTMTVSSSLFLQGALIDDGGILPAMYKNEPLDGAFSNRLLVDELGAHNSTFSTSVISGTKPAWLTITTTGTTNVEPTGDYKVIYCFARINFTGTPTDVLNTKFTIRVASSSGAFQDLEIGVNVGNEKTRVKQVDTFYQLYSDKTEISEGESVTITLRTANYVEGDTIPYNIVGGAGFTSGDIQQATSGTFTLTTVVERIPIFASIGGILSDAIVGYEETRYQVGNITITASADVSTEGTESFRVQLPDFIGKAPPNSVVHVDINIRDTSQAPVVPTFALSASPTSITEGSLFTVTLTTTNVPQGRRYQYKINGVSSGDIDGVPLTGFFEIGADGTSSIIFDTIPNGIVDAKTFTIQIPTLNLSTSVSIADGNPTYALSASASEVSEGGVVLFNLRTTTVADGTEFPYVITGVQSTDINRALTGVITINNNVGGIDITMQSDLETEGTEVLTFAIPSIEQVAQVTVRDTSTTPAPINYNLTILDAQGSPLTGSSYITEGEQFYILIDASVDAIGSGVKYSISGIEQQLIDIPLTGSFRMLSREFFGFSSAFFSQLVTTSKSGQTNTERVVEVSLPDVDKSAVFKLRSPNVQTNPPPAPPTPQPPTPPTPPTSTDPLTIQSSPETFPGGTVGVEYATVGSPSGYFTYTGGSGGVTWTLSSGSLPTGMTSTAHGGGTVLFLSGIPTAAGTYTFTFQATDSDNNTDTATQTITIAASQNNTGGAAPGSGGTVTDVVDPSDLEREVFGVD